MRPLLHFFTSTISCFPFSLIFSPSTFCFPLLHFCVPIDFLFFCFFDILLFPSTLCLRSRHLFFPSTLFFIPFNTLFYSFDTVFFSFDFVFPSILFVRFDSFPLRHSSFSLLDSLLPSRLHFFSLSTLCFLVDTILASSTRFLSFAR